MTKVFFDFLPIVLFFATYKFYNLMMATKVVIVASIVQLILTKAITKKVDNSNIISCVMISILGGATLMFNDEIFVKWKPTAVYWLFALIFAVTQFLTEKPLLQRLGETSIQLSSSKWRNLNLSWGIFFLVMGLANLYVVYNFDTNTWVNFKLFGTFGLTIVFVILQSVYLAKYAQHKLVENDGLQPPHIDRPK